MDSANSQVSNHPTLVGGQDMWIFAYVNRYIGPCVIFRYVSIRVGCGQNWWILVIYAQGGVLGVFLI